MWKIFTGEELLGQVPQKRRTHAIKPIKRTLPTKAYRCRIVTFRILTYLFRMRSKTVPKPCQKTNDEDT